MLIQTTGMSPHNTQNTPDASTNRHSVDSVDGLGRCELLQRELLAAGVVLAVSDAGRLLIDAPRDVLTEDLLARVRADRDGLLALLRGELHNPETAAERMPSITELCPWCGPVRLLDDPNGLRCERCERLAWVFGERSITRADYLGVIWE